MNTQLEDKKKLFHETVIALQAKITAEMQRLDPGLTMTEDRWSRNDHAGTPGGGTN